MTSSWQPRSTAYSLARPRREQHLTTVLAEEHQLTKNLRHLLGGAGPVEMRHQ